MQNALSTERSSMTIQEFRPWIKISAYVASASLWQHRKECQSFMRKSKLLLMHLAAKEPRCRALPRRPARQLVALTTTTEDRRLIPLSTGSALLSRSAHSTSWNTNRIPAKFLRNLSLCGPIACAMATNAKKDEGSVVASYFLWL